MLIATQIILGCTSEHHHKKYLDKPSIISLSDKNNSDSINKDLTLTWRNLRRSGAALHQSGYIHVLSNKKSNILEKRNISEYNHKKDIYSTNKTYGYSLYELSRWRRFCNKGKKMDEYDWNFIKKNEGKVPSVIKNCYPPTYMYSDYKEAWMNFCRNKEITKKMRYIIKNTVHPFSISCKKVI